MHPNLKAWYAIYADGKESNQSYVFYVLHPFAKASVIPTEGGMLSSKNGSQRPQAIARADIWHYHLRVYSKNVTLENKACTIPSDSFTNTPTVVTECQQFGRELLQQMVAETRMTGI